VQLPAKATAVIPANTLLIRRRLRIIAVALLTLSITACGYHVRTAELDSLGFHKVALSCDKSDAWGLCQTLERELKAHKVSLDQHARLSLDVSKITSKERAFTLNTNASADEYELTRSISFSLSDAQQEQARYQNEISAKRIYRHNSDALLAKDRERLALTRALDQSLAREIIRQLTLIRIGGQ